MRLSRKKWVKPFALVAAGSVVLTSAFGVGLPRLVHAAVDNGANLSISEMNSIASPSSLPEGAEPKLNISFQEKNKSPVITKTTAAEGFGWGTSHRVEGQNAVSLQRVGTLNPGLNTFSGLVGTATAERAAVDARNGRDIDLIYEFRDVTIINRMDRAWSGNSEIVGYGTNNLLRNFYGACLVSQFPVDGNNATQQCTHDSAGAYTWSFGGWSRITYRLVYSDTQEEVPNARFWMHYIDIDQPGFNVGNLQEEGHYGADTSEQIILTNGQHDNQYWVEPGAVIRTEMKDGYPSFQSVTTTGSNGTPEPKAGFGVVVYNGFQVENRGVGGQATGMSANGTSTYPDMDIKKTVSKTRAVPGERLTYTISGIYPRTTEANEARSVAISDNLSSFLVASQAQVTFEAYQYEEGNNVIWSSTPVNPMTRGWVTQTIEDGKKFVWTTTENGITELDGARFDITISVPVTNSDTIANANLADNNGCLDIGNAGRVTVTENTGDITHQSSNAVTTQVCANQPDPVDMSLTKEVDKTLAKPGSKLTWTLDLHVGPFDTLSTPKNITVTDPLPSMVQTGTVTAKVLNSAGTDVTSQWNVSINGRSFTATPKTITPTLFSNQDYRFVLTGTAAGEQAVVDALKNSNTTTCSDSSLYGHSSRGVLLSNQGKVTWTNAGTLGNDTKVSKTVETCVPVDEEWEPSITKAVDKAETTPGSTLKYTIKATYPKFSIANRPDSIVISDTLPGHLTAAGATVKITSGSTDVTSQYTQARSGQKFTWTMKNVDTVKNGATHTITITVPVDNAKNIATEAANANSAFKKCTPKTITGKQGILLQNKATLNGKSSQTVDTCVPPPRDYNPRISKNAGTPTVLPGNKAKWTITAVLPEQDEWARPSNITFSDTLDAEFDASKVTFTVTLAGKDVTSNWTMTRDGQKLTWKAKDVSKAIGTHTFTMQVPVWNFLKVQDIVGKAKSSATPYEKCASQVTVTTVSGNKVQVSGTKVPNTAKLTYNDPYGTAKSATSNKPDECIPDAPPYNPTVKKDVDKTVHLSGDIVQWTMTAVLPDQVEWARPSNITFSDTLDPAINASQATFTATLNGKDVTSNWTMTRDGQKLTWKAKDVSKAIGTHTFTVKAPTVDNDTLISYLNNEDKNVHHDTCNVTVTSYNGKQQNAQGIKVPNKTQLTYNDPSATAKSAVSNEPVFCLPPDIPPPTEDPTKLVDRKVIDNGWRISYDIEQTFNPADQWYSGAYYKSVTLIDTLPQNLEYENNATLYIKNKEVDPSLYTVTVKDGKVLVSFTAKGLEELSKLTEPVSYHLRLSGFGVGKMDDKVINSSVTELNKKLGKKSLVTTEIVDISIDKGVDWKGQVVKPGQTVTFTVTVGNRSKNTVPNVHVFDDGGAFLENIKLSDPSQGEIVDGYWNAGNILPGEKATVKVTATVTKDYRVGKDEIVNRAHVTIGERKNAETIEFNIPRTCQVNKTLESDTDRCDEVIGRDNAVLKIDKSFHDVKNTYFTAGREVVFDVTVKNAGKTGKAEYVVVKELPGTQLDKVEFIHPSQGTVDNENQQWNVGELAAGKTATVTVKGTTSNTYNVNEELVNGVIVENPLHPYMGGHQVNVGVDKDTDQYDMVSALEDSTLKVDKALVKEVTTSGGLVTYKVTVKNAGKTGAANVTVSDVPGVGIDRSSVTFSDVSVGDVDDAGVWHVGDMPAGKVETAIVKARLNETIEDGVLNGMKVENPKNPKELTDPAKAKSNVGVDKDDDQADKVFYREDSILQADKKEIDSDVTRHVAGETVFFELTVKNAGSQDAVQVVVDDVLGEGLDNLTWGDVPQGKINEETNQWELGTLKAGQELTVQVSAEFTEDYDPVKGTENRVRIFNPSHPQKLINTCDPNETVSDDKDQCDVVPVVEDSDLRIVKSPTAKTVSQGSETVFTVEVGNFGVDTAVDVKVTDIPEMGIVALYAPSKGEANGAVWNVGDLGPGETATVSAKVQIPADGVGELKNKAHVENPAYPHEEDAYEDNDTLEDDTDQGDVAVVSILDPNAGSGGGGLARTGAAGVLGGFGLAGALAGAGVALVRRRRLAA